jgi:hypothetical protein
MRIMHEPKNNKISDKNPSNNLPPEEHGGKVLLLSIMDSPVQVAIATDNADDVVLQSVWGVVGPGGWADYLRFVSYLNHSGFLLWTQRVCVH